MRGVERVILLDACVSGAAPGSLFRVPAEQVATTPPLTGINLHAFRWDHALAFAKWLLKEDYPQQIDVYLAEAAALEFGAPLSAEIEQAAAKLMPLLRAEMAKLEQANAAAVPA
jgi:hydrogenase maturation protease